MTDEHIIAEFVSLTNSNATIARDFLKVNNWDLRRALKTYTSVHPSPSVLSSGQNLLPEITMENSLPVWQTSAGISYEPGTRFQCYNGFSDRKLSSNFHQINGDDIWSNRPIVDGEILKNDPKKNCEKSKNGGCYVETPSYTFTLPNFNEHDEEFRKFLEKDLIETCALKTLEISGHLNWWMESGLCQRLWPLSTKGDGNCLLHAASLAMWGFHDRLLMLRKALHSILTNGSRRHALWRRWRWQQTHQNNETGLIFSEEEWRNEWDNVIRLSSPEPRSKPTSAEPLSQLNRSPERATRPSVNTRRGDGLDERGDDAVSVDADALYESLEEVHVFALAHVLKRPIVVIADTVLKGSNGEAFAPILFGGVYLPLECCPSECHRSPLLLCYDAAHFSALVPMQSTSQLNGPPSYPIAAVPVTDKQRNLLPLHFCCDPGPDFTWWADSSDEKISSGARLTLEQKLSVLAKYVDLIKLNKKLEPMGLVTDHAAPSGPNAPHPLADESVNRAVGCTGVAPCVASPCAAGSLAPNDKSAVVPVCGSLDTAGGSIDALCVGTQQAGPIVAIVRWDGSFSSKALTLPAGGDSSRRWRGSTGSMAEKSPYTTDDGRMSRWQRTAHFLNATTRATWLRLKRTVKRRLTSRTRQGSSARGAGRSFTLPRASNSADSGRPRPKMSLSLSDLRDQSSLVAARLRPDAHHRFMDEMICSYMKTARQRFDAERLRKNCATGEVAPTATSKNDVMGGGLMRKANGVVAAAKPGCVAAAQKTAECDDDSANISARNGGDLSSDPKSTAGRVAGDGGDDDLADGVKRLSDNGVTKNGRVDGEVVADQCATKTDDDVIADYAASVVRRTGAGGGRERFSRSFSAASITVKCMNGKCDERATHRTNFLCDECFDKQRQMMQSFSAPRGGAKKDWTHGPEIDKSMLMTSSTRLTPYDESLPLPRQPESHDYARRIARSTFYATLAFGNREISPSMPNGAVADATPLPSSLTSVTPTPTSLVVPRSVTVVRPCRQTVNFPEDCRVDASSPGFCSRKLTSSLNSNTMTSSKSSQPMSFASATPLTALTSCKSFDTAGSAPSQAYRAIETSYDAAEVRGLDGGVLMTQYYVTSLPPEVDDFGGQVGACAAVACKQYDVHGTTLCQECAVLKKKLEDDVNGFT